MRLWRSTTDEPAGAALLLPEEFEALAARMESRIRRVQVAARMAVWIDSVVAGIGLLWWWYGAGVFWGTMAFFVFVLIMIAHLKALKMRSFKNDAGRLEKFVKHTHETTHLRTILDLCSRNVWSSDSMEWQVCQEADAAVLRLLPLIKPNHAEIFNTQHRARLRHGLFHHRVGDMGSWRGDGYCLVVLAALEQIGDRRDLRDVERIRKESYISEEVRTTAQRCAQTIAARIEREDHKDLLLRPGLKPESGNTLLRPAGERADTPPQQLLRSVSADDSDTSA